MFRALCILALAIVVGFAEESLAAEPTAANAASTKRILLIGAAKDGHPYRTHEYMPVCELLAKCLRQTPGVEPVVSRGWPADAAASEGASSIVVYVPWGANVLFDGPQRQQVKQLLDAGAGLVALHWATGAEKDEYGQLWLDQLGGWFHTDFSPIQHLERRLQIADPDHPVARGVIDFTLFDEFYFKLRFADRAKSLVTVDFEGSPQTIAWTYIRGSAQADDPRAGRSFGFDAGHYHKNFGNDFFRRLVINGILWTAHVEIPAGGAKADLAPADLELAPPPTSPAK
ncbi:MAG: ThuA domain-containing protein [Pirellulales bacterium]|nr:ThuA domain-containing protein [Pirellulales bacterium]